MSRVSAFFPILYFDRGYNLEYNIGAVRSELGADLRVRFWSKAMGYSYTGGRLRWFRRGALGRDAPARSYADKQLLEGEKRRLEAKMQDEKRRLEERLEQLRAEKERLLYEVQHPTGAALSTTATTAAPSAAACRRDPANPTTVQIARRARARQEPPPSQTRRPPRCRPAPRPAQTARAANQASPAREPATPAEPYTTSPRRHPPLGRNSTHSSTLRAPQSRRPSRGWHPGLLPAQPGGYLQHSRGYLQHNRGYLQHNRPYHGSASAASLLGGTRVPTVLRRKGRKVDD